jgi:hypothetical protein
MHETVIRNVAHLEKALLIAVTANTRWVYVYSRVYCHKAVGAQCIESIKQWNRTHISIMKLNPLSD